MVGRSNEINPNVNNIDDFDCSTKMSTLNVTISIPALIKSFKELECAKKLLIGKEEKNFCIKSSFHFLFSVANFFLAWKESEREKKKWTILFNCGTRIYKKAAQFILSIYRLISHFFVAFILSPILHFSLDKLHARNVCDQMKGGMWHWSRKA